MTCAIRGVWGVGVGWGLVHCSTRLSVGMSSDLVQGGDPLYAYAAAFSLSSCHGEIFGRFWSIFLQKYAEHAESAGYAEYAEYAENADYAEYAKYVEYAVYAKYA